MSLADRMKEYETRETGRRLLPRAPVIVRVDGRGFSKLTRPLARPYDERLSRLMIEVTRALVTELGARIGYTQSDEISLVLLEEELPFGGRAFKLTGISAALATAHFLRGLDEALPELRGELAVFDARVFSVPTREEACNALLWRERDATKNSLSMAARAHYSHKQLDKKRGPELHDLLHEKGVNWNDYPALFKRGTYVQRRTVARAFTDEERAKLPPQHRAHDEPDLVIERSQVEALQMPPFASVENRAEVVFEGASPRSSSAL